MGKLTVILFCFIPILAAANPPPGTGIRASGTPVSVKPTPPTPAKSAPAQAGDKAAAAIVASRYAGADPKAYTTALAKRLAIGNRTTDAFGQPQDPDAKPIVKPTLAKSNRRYTTQPAMPLSDIVSQIKVTTIMPKERRFLVGDRAFGVGDKIPLNYRNKQIRTQITFVSAGQIVFKNVETGEIGTLKLDGMPGGITRGTSGTSGITAKGMTPANADAPLEIDSSATQSVGSITP